MIKIAEELKKVIDKENEEYVLEKRLLKIVR